MKKIILITILLLIVISCSNNKQSKNVVELSKKKNKIANSKKKISGNTTQVLWLKKYFTESVTPIKSTKKPKNYSMEINILVSDKNLLGKDWDLSDKYPDLRLYILNNETYTLLGSKKNSKELNITQLLILSNKSIINLKLADEEKFYSDDETGTKDSPIGEINFNFQGQGKYLYFSGGAIFIITFKEL